MAAKFEIISLYRLLTPGKHIRQKNNQEKESWKTITKGSSGGYYPTTSSKAKGQEEDDQEILDDQQSANDDASESVEEEFEPPQKMFQKNNKEKIGPKTYMKKISAAKTESVFKPEEFSALSSLIQYSQSVSTVSCSLKDKLKYENFLLRKTIEEVINGKDDCQ